MLLNIASRFAELHINNHKDREKFMQNVKEIND